MILKNLLTTLLVLITLNAYSQFWKKQLRYPLPDVTLTASQVCGKNVCNPGDPGRLLHYTSNPFSPPIKKGANAQMIALEILGQTIPVNDIFSKDYNTCSNTSQNPFNINDIENIRLYVVK